MKIKTLLVIGMAVLFGVTSLAGGINDVLAEVTGAPQPSFDSQSFQAGDQTLRRIDIGAVRLIDRTVVNKTILKQAALTN